MTSANGGIDLTTDHGRRTVTRLSREEVVWLTTVDPGGAPQPTPVWFLWLGGGVRDSAGGGDGIGRVLLLSRPHVAKLRNIRRNPRVSLSFSTDEYGDDVVVLLGDADVDESGLPDREAAEFDAKYAAGLRRLGTTAEQFRADFSVLVRVRPDRLRGW